MRKAWLLLMAVLLLVAAGGARAATLLWLTADTTPTARSALVERLSVAAGLSFSHLEFPLQGPTALSAAEAARLDAALQRAAVVWVDAPHATVLARLQALAGERLAAFARRPGMAGRVVWAGPGEAAGQGMAAYLQAGGERNLAQAAALAEALAAGRAAPELPPASPWPAQGVYHPEAPGLFADASAFVRWHAAPERPAVVVLVHRHHFVNGGTAWLDSWLRLFEQQGLSAYAAFSQQVDGAGLARLLEVPAGDGTRRLHARVIVSHQLLSQAGGLQPLFERWGAPLLLTQPYRQGDGADWSRDDNGLAQADVPFYLAQPEAAGAIDPVLVSAQGERGRRTELIERQARAVVAKARRLIELRDKPVAAKRLVAMVYNYPPGGSNFGASFLNVPRSLERVSAGLAEAGYATEALPEGRWIEALKPLVAAGKAEPLALYVSQLQDTSEASTEPAARSIALEMQSRYLHPGWLAAQKAEGYAGTLQVVKALQFSWGWQVTAPDSVRPDHWQSFYEVLVRDRHQLGVPDWLRSHPQAYAQALERLVQADRLGYWQPDAAARETVAGLYREMTRAAPLANELASVRRWVEPAAAPALAPARVPRATARPRAAPAALPPRLPEPRRGLLLERQPDTPLLSASGWMPSALSATLMALLLAGGAAWQARRRPLRTVS